MMAELDKLALHVRRSVEVLDACSQNPPLVQIADYGDKYALETTAVVDCASRWELCRGICCRLEFPLSQQDLDEGVIAWNPARPYICAKGEDKRCVHQDGETGACGVYERRPAPCRTYDCSNDDRIWLDFQGRKINPRIFDSSWPAWSEEDGEWPE